MVHSYDHSSSLFQLQRLVHGADILLADALYDRDVRDDRHRALGVAGDRGGH